MSFLSTNHVSVETEWLPCQGCDGSGFCPRKLTQRTLSGSTDVLSAKLRAPGGDRIIPRDSVSSGKGHSLNTLNILVLGEKNVKSHFSLGISLESFKVETVTFNDTVVRGQGVGRE